MNETTYVYIVHSDINENNIYAEFATEEEAIEYAKCHIDELTYVDRVEALVDEEGDIVEMFDSETIWAYDEEDEFSVEEDDDYWNQLAKEEEERKEDEGLLGDTTWFEDLDTDSLVETLEENEDIVECKECFELFPKADCVKIEVGYLCPHCHGAHCEDKECIEDEPIVLFDVADEDVFKVDFPEVERFSFSAENEMVPDEPTPEVENDPISEPECVGPECEAPVEAPITKEETIDTLVKDEEEAIDGYDKAKIEIEANSELDEKEKEEILDTIEHIKEEEVEHIEELKELVDEVEETKETEIESTPLSEAWELDSAHITDEVKTTGRLVKGTFVVIGFKDTKEQTNFRGEYEYNLDTKKLKLKNVAFKFSPKHVKEIEAQLKTDIDEYLDDKGNYTVNVSQPSDPDPIEPEVGESTETNPRALDEHVNEEHPAIESEQELEGTDNAVVDCKVADVVTHSEDEKPVDCKGENKPLEKPLTESTTKNILDMVKDTVDSRGYDTWIYGGSGYISYCIEIIKDGDEYEANEYISTESGVGDTDPEFIYSSTDFRDVIKFLLDEGYFDTEDPRDSQDISRTDAEGYLRNLTEATHAQVAKPEGSRTLAYNNALTYAKKNNKPYIYGYTNHTGKFFALDLPLRVTGNPGEAEKEFRNKYKNSKVVYIAYPDKDFITESLIESIEDDLIKAYNDIPVVEADLEAIEQELSKLRYTEIYDTEDFKELRAKVSAIRKEISDLEHTYGHFTCINDDGDRDWVVFDRKKEAELAPKIAELNSIWRTLDSELDTLISERSTKINNMYGADLDTKKAQVNKVKNLSKETLANYIESEKANIEAAIRELRAEKDYKLDLNEVSFNPKTNTIFVPFTHSYSEKLTIEDFDFDGDDARCRYSEDDAEEYVADYLYEYLAEALGEDLEVDEDGDYIIPNSDWKLLKDSDTYFEELPELWGYSYSPATYWDPAEENYSIEGKLICSITCYLIKKLGTKPDLKESLYKFTKQEQEEYNMDEDGNSLDSYDTYVRCGWCGEIFTKDSCVFEKDFGWLCDRCQDELKYHGGHLDIIVDPTEEDIERAENNK